MVENNNHELLIHLFGNNLQLKTVIMRNEMKELSFFMQSTKLCPNVKNFTYEMDNDEELNEIHNWKSLESINCRIYDKSIFWKC